MQGDFKIGDRVTVKRNCTKYKDKDIAGKSGIVEDISEYQEYPNAIPHYRYYVKIDNLLNPRQKKNCFIFKPIQLCSESEYCKNDNKNKGDIVLQAINKGFYYIKDNDICYAIEAVFVGNINTGFFTLTKQDPSTIGTHTFNVNDDLKFNINDYGQTWALTEKELEDKIIKVWKPKTYEQYYEILSNGSVIQAKWVNDIEDELTYRIGNCFKTREETLKIVRKLEITAKLKQVAEQLNAGWRPIFGGLMNHVYFICYDFYDNDVVVRDSCSIFMPDNVYFKSTEAARKAIKLIGADRLKKDYFGIED